MDAIEIAERLMALGKTPEACTALVEGVNNQPASQDPIRVLKDELQSPGDSLERELLRHAMAAFEPRIDALPVHTTVKPLIRKEFARFSSVPGSGNPPLLVGADPFIAACMAVTLRRFPSGPMDWVVSGAPRSWFPKMPVRDLPMALRYIFLEFGGIRPAFYMHVAHPPRNRSLIIEKEVRKSYYRMARSLGLQPEIKGIMCASWFHDPGAINDYPYLAYMNEPYLKLGGRLLTNLGPAPVESGFLKYNPERRERWERGELKLMTGIAMWPRKAALAWAEAHPELE